MYVVGGVAVIGTNLSELATTYLVRYAVNAIDGAGRPDDVLTALTDLASRWQVSLLWLLAGLFVGLVVLRGALRYVWRWGFVMTSLRIARDLRRDLIAHLLKSERAYFERARSGELMSILTSDVEAIRMFVGIGLLLIVDNLMYFLVVPIAMWRIHPQVTLVLLLPLPLIPLLTQRLGNAVHRRFSACQEQLAAIAARAQEGIAGMKVAKSFVQAEPEVREMATLAQGSLDRQLKLARVQAVFMPALSLVVSLEIFLLMWFGGGAVVAGSLDPGQLFQLLMLSLMLAYPMMGLGWTLSLWQRGAASHRRYREVLDRPPAIADDPALVDQTAVGAGRVTFRGLTFAYPGAEHPALIDIDLEIPAGATVALVGPVGAGKSTLAALVPRRYEAPAGTIELDGVDLRRYPLDVLRSAVGVVPQQTFLFSQSIAENIALGQPSADAERVAKVARLAGLGPDLEALPEGLQTPLGERGVNLSGGQRQRVALARALRVQPRILILDDCLSAVDTATEERILRGLRELTRERTTIVVAHRISTVMGADLICVLEAGRIRERGTHAELLAAGGWYAQTFTQQQLERAVEGPGA